MKSLLKNKFLLIVLVITLGVAVWFWFFRGDEVEEIVISDTEQQTLQTEAEVQSLLKRIQAIRFDESVFADRVYGSLRRFTQFFTSTPVGRSDPFDNYSRASADRVTTSDIDPSAFSVESPEDVSEEETQ